MRPTATLLLLALVAWFATIAAAGAAAMAAFRALPALGISVAGTEAFFAGDTQEMGRFAAGRMLHPLFGAADWVQFGASSVCVGCTVRLARLRGLRGSAWARWTLAGSVACAAVLLAWRAWGAPAMDADLLAYWEAVERGDADAARTARSSFDAAHAAADAGFRAQLALVLAAIVAFVPATVPSARPAAGPHA